MAWDAGGHESVLFPIPDVSPYLSWGALLQVVWCPDASDAGGREPVLCVIPGVSAYLSWGTLLYVVSYPGCGYCGGLFLMPGVSA